VKKGLVLAAFAALFALGCSIHIGDGYRYYHRDKVRLRLYANYYRTNLIDFTAVLSGESTIPGRYRCLDQEWQISGYPPKIITNDCDPTRPGERRVRSWVVHERYDMSHRFMYWGRTYRVRLILRDHTGRVVIRSNRIKIRIH
jgi:hypothetical protein